MNVINSLKEISNRGRVAFAIFCLESAMDHFQLDKTKWKFVLDESWKFCYSDMPVWQERFLEVIPFAVSEKIDWKIKDYMHLTKEEHDALQNLYDETDPDILAMIDLIHRIGSANMLTTVNSEALKMVSIPYLQSLIELMNKNNIPLPDIKLFEKFPVTDNCGWGSEFTREDVLKK